MRRPKSFILAAFAMVAAAVVPMLTASAAATPAQGSTPVPAATETPSAEMISNFPMSRAFATKAEADVATSAVKKAYGDKPTEALAAGRCVNSWIYIIDTVGYFTHARADSTIRFFIAAGYYPCRNLILGGRYNGCGATNANGWILLPNIWDGPISAGFVISTCTVDP